MCMYRQLLFPQRVSEIPLLITSLPASPRVATRATVPTASFCRQCNLQRPLNASMNEVGKLLEYRSTGCMHTRWVKENESQPRCYVRVASWRSNQFQIVVSDTDLIRVSYPRTRFTRLFASYGYLLELVVLF